MSYFTDSENNFTVYEAPKNGGTTLRLWICYAGTGEIIKSSDSGYYTGTEQTYPLLKEWGYKNEKFKKSSEKRFASKEIQLTDLSVAFYDKAIKEGRIKTDIDTFLDNFADEIEKSTPTMYDSKTNFLKFHFAPQSWHFGDSPDYYDHVFDISEVSTNLKSYLEDKWNIGLPDLHARNNGRKFDLTTRQINKVKEIYREDFENGWY